MYYTLTHLQRLIASMSESQKRYFWLHSADQRETAEQPLYLRLYREIADDRTELSETLNDQSVETRKGAKNRLRKHILKKLGDYYHDQFIDISLPGYFSQLTVLFEIGLRDEALDILNQAIRLARKHERFGFLLEIMGWEKRLNHVLDQPTRSTSKILNEEVQLIAKVNQVIILEQIYSRTKEMKKAYGYVKGEMIQQLQRETIHAATMPSLIECHSQKAMHYYHFIHALYYWMVIDPLKAYHHSQQLVLSSVDAITPAEYVDGILENVTSCVCLAYFEEAISWLAQAETFMDKYKLNQSHSFAVRMASYNMCYLLEIFNYMGDDAQLSQSILRTVHDLELYNEYIPVEVKQVIKANLMNAYIGIGDLRKADQMWLQLFNKKSKAIRPDVYDDLYIFRLFRLYQEGIFDVIPSMVASAVRYYKTYGDFEKRYRVQLNICKAFLQKDALKNKGNRRMVMQKIKILLADLTRESGVNQYQERFSFYKIWIESLLSNKAFAWCASNWYRKFKARKGRVLKQVA